MSTCKNFPECGACNSWNLDYQTQKKIKTNSLQNILNSQNINYSNKIEFTSCGESELRHRIDFTVLYDDKTQQHLFGFYDQNKKIMHINKCPQLHPTLQNVYTEFINFDYLHFPVKKGSVRLRVSPIGLKGCWLDFSNLDIKNLLDDKKFLNQLIEAGYFVEIGQKGKKLTKINNQFKLTDPDPQYWFKTTDLNGNDINLKCLISDFTQPSWLTANVLVAQTLNWINDIANIKNILEFGSGIGQFSIPFLLLDSKLTSCEINTSSAAQLLLNTELLNLTHNLNLQLGDFQNKSIGTNYNFDLVFVNPSRSGLKKFTEEIIKTQSKYLIYISCFPESMALDLKKICEHYKIIQIKIVDQFPQTLHFETCVLLEKLG